MDALIFFIRRKELDTDTHARSAFQLEVRQGSCELRNAIRGMPGSEFEPRSPLQKEIPPTRVVFLFGALSICAANRPPAATFIEKRREPAKVSPANTPFLAKNEGFCIRQTKRICCRHPCAKRISIRGEVGFLRRAHKLHTPCMDLNVPTRMDGAFCFDCKRRKHTQTGGTERFSVKFAAAPPCL